MTEKWYSNVPISKPVEHPAPQGSFNGFGWHDALGFVLERGDNGKDILSELKRLRRVL